MAIIVLIIKKYWYILTILLMSIALYYLFKENDKLNKEVIINHRNIGVLGSDSIIYYKDMYGHEVARNQALVFSQNDFKAYMNNRLSEFEKRTGNIKNIDSYIESAFNTKGSFYIGIRDSVVNDTVRLKTFNYNDGFLILNCSTSKDSANCNYEYRDSIEYLVFLNKNWKWYQFKKKREMKKKGLTKLSPVVEVTTKNPKTKVYSLRAILLEK